MSTKIYVPIVIAVVVTLFGTFAFAGGPGNGGMGGMGGGNSGMMGGGHGMMGGHMMSDPWQGQPGNQYPSYQYKQTETEKLREEIRQKRQITHEGLLMNKVRFLEHYFWTLSSLQTFCFHSNGHLCEIISTSQWLMQYRLDE